MRIHAIHAAVACSDIYVVSLVTAHVRKTEIVSDMVFLKELQTIKIPRFHRGKRNNAILLGDTPENAFPVEHQLRDKLPWSGTRKDITHLVHIRYMPLLVPT